MCTWECEDIARKDWAVIVGRLVAIASPVPGGYLTAIDIQITSDDNRCPHSLALSKE